MHHHETARTNSRGAPKDTETSLATSSMNSNEPSASWMAFNNIIDIEDDDLMFGGKPLCTWYEEDRRCSMGEESRHHGYSSSNSSQASPGSTTGSSTDEDEERGRRRDRPQYISKPHKKH
ncbi:hypothetical protein SBRCBS47491_007914 [Sporothrix bragantina]|uniref:Uncharacterized protein n=1 Tax=Sporothrix bragantina TaxID=671064 RepID=A0ABP0CJM4_9PEZI